MPRRPTLGTAVGAAAVVGALLVGLQPLSDNSFLTHLATGRLLLDGTWPDSDPFSYTAAGEPWAIQSWLASVVYAAVEEVGGGRGLVVLHGMMTAALAALCWRLTRPAQALLVRAALMAVALLVGVALWQERPLLMALVLLAATLVVVVERRAWWWAAPMFLVWVHVHGSWPVGLVVVAVVVAGERLDGAGDPQGVRRLGAATLGVLAGAVGPAGPGLLLFPFQLLGERRALSFIEEWQAPRWQEPWQLVFLLQVGLAGWALWRRRTVTHAALLVLLTAMALVSMRNIGVASVALLPTTAAGLDGLGALRSDARSPVAAPAVGLLAVVAASGLVVATDRAPYDLDRRFPVAMLAAAGDERLAHQMPAGNLLSAVRGREAAVFVDDRVDLYAGEVLDDALALEAGSPEWRDVLDRHRVEVVVWEADAPLGALLAADADWRIARHDGEWLLAERR